MSNIKQLQSADANHSDGVSTSFARRWMLSFLVIGMILVTTEGIYLYQEFLTLVAARVSLNRKTQELIDITKTFVAVQDAETAQRGYVLTGKASYLDSYYRVLPELPKKLDALKTLTKPEPEQAQRVQVLVGLVDSKLNDIKKIIGIYRTSGQAAAIKYIDIGSGDTVLNEIRQRFETMDSFDRDQLRKETTALAVRREVFFNTFPMIGISSLLLFIGFSYFMRLYVSVTAKSRRAEKLLRQSLLERSKELEAQAQLLDLTHDTILVRDFAGTIRFWNHGGEIAYGYTPEEAVGQVYHELLKTEFPKSMEDINRDFLSSGRWEGELTHLTKDGRKVVVSSRWALKVKQEGQPSVVMEINNDITAQKHAERILLENIQNSADENLKRKVLELERSNDELKQFAYVCSHDLQEPLRVISNFNQLLAKRYKGKLDEKADEFIGFTVDAAKRMQALINDLLMYSRVQAKEKTLCPVECNSSVRTSLANLKMAIEESGAHFDVSTLPCVLGDQLQFVQLFQNLIANAIKFRSSRELVISISAEQKEDDWVFCVADNGIGMDMQFADKIFIIFQRLHDREAYSGSGIGLAICKKIVQQHSGKIWVESQPGKGTSFYFSVPVAKASPVVH